MQRAILPGIDDIVSSDIHISAEKLLIFRLKSRKDLLQRINVILQLDALGVHAGIHILTAQLLQRMVDGTDGTGVVHRLGFDDHLGARQGHDRGQPCVPHRKRIFGDTEIVSNDIIDNDCTVFHMNAAGLCPLGIILRGDVFDLPCVKIHAVGILEEQCQLLIIQLMGVHGTVFQRTDGVGRMVQQHGSAGIIQHEKITGVDDAVIVIHTFQIGHTIIDHFDTALQLVLPHDAVFKGIAELNGLIVLLPDVLIKVNGAIQFDNVHGVIRIDVAKHRAKSAFNGVIAAEAAEKAKFHRGNFQNDPVISLLIPDHSVLDGGKTYNIIHAAHFFCSFGFFVGSLFHFGLVGAFEPDFVLFFLGQLMTAEKLIIRLALFFGGLLLGLLLLAAENRFFLRLFLDLLPFYQPEPAEQMPIGKKMQDHRNDRLIHWLIVQTDNKQTADHEDSAKII